MIPADFDYKAPTSLDEALSLLAEYGEDAKVLAGGHSLLPLMKLRLASPRVLIDLAQVDGLSFVRDAGNQIVIGAMTPYAALQDSHLLQRRAPLLAQAAGMVGDQQVRNRGTLGGALAHADPAGDMPVIVTALGGTIRVRSSRGERTIAAADFFTDIFTSVLDADEILTEVVIPAHDGAAQAYEKFQKRAIDWAIVGAAVSLTRTNGSIDSASVVLTNVAPTPARATAVQSALAGKLANSDTVRQASELAAEGLHPSAELNASADYKEHLARVLTRRALTAALGIA
jgi:carbon-monoxide dehydrogenase medium subunit